MIPKSYGDSTPPGQRPLCVLPVVYRLWASVRLGHLQSWFCSWFPDSVKSTGKGVSTVDAWYTSTLYIEEVLTDATHDDVHIFVVDVVKSFDTVDQYPRLWLEDASVAFMPRLGFALSQPQGLERLGPEMLVSPRDAP